ncbi:hypothetical protein RCL49_25300, partial [Salmonella enterica subsp. enterica serovar Typhimurium]
INLSSQFNKFSEFAGTAPFPSYLTSVAKSMLVNTQRAVSTNQGYYSAETTISNKNLIMNNFKDRITRFMDKYRTF